jgi:hypothetical protein
MPTPATNPRVEPTNVHPKLPFSLAVFPM